MFLRKVAEIECNVDKEEEGFVECLDTVHGEEKNSTVVLHVKKTEKTYEKKKKIRKIIL